MIDNWVAIEDDPDMVEVMVKEEIEALDDLITSDANGSSVYDFDVDGSEDEEGLPHSRQQKSYSHMECTEHLDMMKLYMESNSFPAEDFMQLVSYDVL